MLLKWILKLIGFGFLLGAGGRCHGSGGEHRDEADRIRRARRRAARRIHRIADAIANADADDDEEEQGAPTGE